ncbi:MAG: response regulator containing a CheY-like receiver domain and an domain [Bacteroidetes bacterium]|jgi:serine phosphatase RsbU (regulator of sigma subunit)|nr:response regulator containing a CheY-like receiver domain and an domain [Bacteroidota bacterium]
MKKHLKILVLENNPADAEHIQRELSRSGMLFTFKVVNNREDFIITLNNFEPDLVLSDHSLPSFNALEALTIINHNYNIPFMIVTNPVSEEYAVSCIKAGVNDYILKSALHKLPAAIGTLFAENTQKKEKESLEVLNRQINNSFKEIEEKNTNLTECMVYTGALQEALLSGTSKLDEVVSDWFIYNKPKNVIGGDFYWFEKKNNHLIIAVADCTGHGVRGAIMSIAGTLLLNKIVNEKHITKPAEILQTLNYSIYRFFKENSSRDGMDIAICSIDLETHVVEYAGANRPLWVMHHSGLQEISPTKHSIGGLKTFVSHEYKTEQVLTEPGDMIYLVTDGIIDQFGGIKDKKLKKIGFQNFISTLRFKHLIEQKVIIENFVNEWMGEHEQVDDILIIGIKI